MPVLQLLAIYIYVVGLKELLLGTCMTIPLEVVPHSNVKFLHTLEVLRHLQLVS